MKDQNEFRSEEYSQFGENQKKRDQTSHHTQPHFFNQPTYQAPNRKDSESKGSDIYLKVLIDENNQLKRDVKELTEVLNKFRKGIGNKKRRILNEIVSLISTKNSFDKRLSLIHI